jgi:hypothetical protein
MFFILHTRVTIEIIFKYIYLLNKGFCFKTLISTDEQQQQQKKTKFTTIKNVSEEFYFQYLFDFFVMVITVVYDLVDV